MYFVNYDQKILVFWFHKCGHTSLIDFFNSIGNFTLYEAWNQLDSYSFIEQYKPELLNYRKCMITRNPMDYSISGFKHFTEAKKQSHRIRKYFDQILMDRFSSTEYNLNRHLELLLSTDTLFHPDIQTARDFFTHCCRKQSYTYRTDVKIIHLEKIYQLSSYLTKNGVQVKAVFPHSNKRVLDDKIEITDTTFRLWSLLYKNECEILGYDFFKTLENYH